MHGANFSIVDNAKKTPAELASENGKAEVARFLDQYEANIKLQGMPQSAIFNTPHRGVERDEKGKGKASLHSFSEEGNLQDVKWLLGQGAHVDSRDRAGWTPLHVASRHGQLQVLRMLIDHRADVNARKQDLWTPLHLSAANGQLEVVKLLLDHGADAGVINDDGHTPYQLSLAHGHRKVAALLKGRAAHGG
jgi:ankyrin repeat protein